MALAMVGRSCDLVAVAGGRPSGSRQWLSLVLREQDDRGELQEKKKVDGRGREIRLTREAVVALGIFPRVLLKKYKLHNQIKR